MTADSKTIFQEFRFRVVGYWTLDVRVLATDLEQAKGKLRAEADVIGVTPQELNRRYHEPRHQGEQWCDNGLDDFWVALAEVTVEQPVYHDDHGATLFVRVGEYAIEELVEYLFTVKYSPNVAYEVSIPATSLYAALDTIFRGQVSLTITEASTPEEGDQLEMTYDDLSEELALLAMLTRDQARYHNDDYSVDYQLVHTSVSEEG